MTDSTAVVVQARLTSTRLPGKVLLPLGGETVLWHVLTRCRAIAGADLVCCAIPDSETNGPLQQEAERAGAVVVGGSEHDVLERYCAAAEAVEADVIMRVTSDCPVIDPHLCDRVLDARAESGADYACNNMPRLWPHGLDCEAFTRTALERAADAADDRHDREHVTPWLRRDDSVRRINVDGPGGALARQRLTLDFPEDYAFFKALFSYLPAQPHIASQAEITAVIDDHAEIEALNAAHRIAAA